MAEDIEDEIGGFTRIADHLAVGIAIVDMNGLIVYSNEAVCSFLGYSKDELKGKHFSEITYPDDLEVDLTLFREILEGKRQSYVIDKRYIRKDHAIVWGHLSVSVIFDRDGLPQYTAVSCEDITGRKRIELSLQDKESLLKAITNTAIDSIFCKDSNRRYTYVNRAMTELLGCREKDLLGKTPLEVFGPEGAAVIKEVDDMAFSGLPVNEIRPLMIDGKKRFFHTIQVPMQTDENGKVTGINGIVRDITDHITAQEEKLNLERELRHSHKMHAIGTLAGGIAHDFNNILATILGYADMAVTDIPDWSPAKYQIEEVLKAGHRAKDLVRQILTFNRKNDQNRIPVRIDLLVEEALEFLRATIPTTIDFQSAISPSCGNIMADPTQIHQILMNLFTNAAHAMEIGGGTLHIRLHPVNLTAEDLRNEPDLQPGPYVKLSVADTGTGMEPEIIDRIFDPYFTTKEIGKGSGMGLAVVLGIVKNHDGMIRVESAAGKGTKFRLFFPRTQRQAIRPAQMANRVPKGNERILIVDDDISLINLTRRRLEAAGYKVTTRTAGTEALEAFRAAPDSYDLVITDQTMPKITGENLAIELLKIRPNIPIILCTGYSPDIDAEKAKDIGISAYITKPVENTVLTGMVRKLLDTGRIDGEQDLRSS